MKVRKHLFIAIVSAILIVAAVGNAQIPSGWTPRFKLTDHSLSLSPGALTIELQNMPTGTDWAVGARVDSGTAATVQIGLIRFSTGSDRSVSIGGEDLPASSLVISSGSILLKNLAQYAGDRLFVYIRLPRETAVQINLNGTNVARIRPSPGFMVHDGETLSGVPRWGLSVLNLVLDPYTPPVGAESIVSNTPKITKLSDNVYVANVEALATHVIQVQAPQPGASKGSAAGTGRPADVVTAYLLIDEQGKVTSARCESPDAAAVAQCRAAAEEWRFKPFLVNGKPVPVHGQWPFLFDGTRLISLASLQKRDN